MDHDYELASYDRTMHHIHDKEKLSKPASYWRSIAPTRAYEEMLVRGTWEHKDVAREARRGSASTRSSARAQEPQEQAAPAAVAASATASVPASSPAPAEGATPWSEDDAKREERRRKALERKAKRAAKSGG